MRSKRRTLKRRSKQRGANLYMPPAVIVRRSYRRRTPWYFRSRRRSYTRYYKPAYVSKADAKLLLTILGIGAVGATAWWLGSTAKNYIYSGENKLNFTFNDAGEPLKINGSGKNGNSILKFTKIINGNNKIIKVEEQNSKIAECINYFIYERSKNLTDYKFKCATGDEIFRIREDDLQRLISFCKN